MKKQNGFTLIELVIVIIVLGILAATAVPKFINLQDDAKVSAMKGVESALHSAANIVYSKAAIDGVEGEDTGSINDAGTTIQTVYGYPKGTAQGIGASVELSGFGSKYTTGTPNTVVFWNGTASTGTATCIKYTEATDTARYSILSNTCTTLNI
ncbi:prepilin-type N-terminal cleavage/methylation domain-containing protein [Moritella sp. 36]|uniref:type II secretion system protein n=1 Tax=Moritella sp. 36 TaxID=2746233 RepID=UPI001BAADF19|nr:prepilin-type N-terminal cleavage/methylation domain-containing protein [Moritella sp. 36]QUM87511.1 prepilin-type N-terminal cleavage/methylation domain-containing protein [Moritella sp. 36]